MHVDHLYACLFVVLDFALLLCGARAENLFGIACARKVYLLCSDLFDTQGGFRWDDCGHHWRLDSAGPAAVRHPDNRAQARLTQQLAEDFFMTGMTCS